MSACSKYRCRRYPFGLGRLKPKFSWPNLSYVSRDSPPNEANTPSANGTYLTLSHGSARRLGSLRNRQSSSYVGNGYLRSASVGLVWAAVRETARTINTTRTRVPRDSISALVRRNDFISDLNILSGWVGL